MGAGLGNTQLFRQSRRIKRFLRGGHSLDDFQHAGDGRTFFTGCHGSVSVYGVRKRSPCVGARKERNGSDFICKIRSGGVAEALYQCRLQKASRRGRRSHRVQQALHRFCGRRAPRAECGQASAAFVTANRSIASKNPPRRAEKFINPAMTRVACFAISSSAWRTRRRRGCQWASAGSRSSSG